MVSVSTRNACLTQERLLEDITGGAANPYNINLRSWQFSQAVKDAQRSSGVAAVQFIPGRGERPKIDGCYRYEYKYKVKRCNPATEVEECATNDCEVGTSDYNDWLYAQPVMNNPFEYKFTQSQEEFRCLCDGQRADFLRQMREAYESLKTAQNNRWISQFVGGVGNYFTTDCLAPVNSLSNPKTLPVFNTQGQPQPMAFFKATQEYKRMGVTSTPFMVGGEFIDAYNFARPLYAGANDVNIANDPVRLRGNFNIYADYDVDLLIGDGEQHILSFIPGAIFPLTWHRFRSEGQPLGSIYYGDDRVVKQTFDLGAAFGDPGFWVDQIIAIDPCTDCDVKITYTFRLHTDLGKIPEDAFSAACGHCWNYCLNWLVDCADPTCDIVKR